MNFKRILTVFMAVVLCCSAMACVNNGGTKPTVTDEPTVTDDPAVTDEPVVTDEPAVTDEPTAAAHKDGIPVEVGNVFEYDFDSDGANDTLLVTEVIEDYTSRITVTVTLAAHADNPYVENVTDCYGIEFVIVTDFDMSDGATEILYSYTYDSDDTDLVALRIDSSGSITQYVEYCSIDPNEGYADGILHVYTRREILGTFFVYEEFVVNADGYKSMTDVFRYVDGVAITVIAPFTVSVIDEATGETHEFELTPGMTVTPIETDSASYVLVTLSTGENAYIYFEPYGDYGIVSIGGVVQDELLDVTYCD